MRFDKLTIKLQEALQEAQAIAQRKQQQRLEPEHLLVALIDQPDGLVPELLEKAGVAPSRLRQQFRPEFLNRIDDIVCFTRLSPASLTRIVELQVTRAQQRLAERRVTLKLTDKAKAFLAKEGYDPIFGARPLRRAVQKHLMDPLALRLLEGTLTSGQTITVDLPAAPNGRAAQAGQNGSHGLAFTGE